MSALVRIPTPLRKMTNGLNKVEIESATLGHMVTDLEAAYPGFKERLRRKLWQVVKLRYGRGASRTR